MSEAEAEGQDVSAALREVMIAYEHSNAALAGRLGLGPSDFAALNHLLTRGPIGPAALGTLLGMRSASATALVDRLEDRGHVRRTRHATDRRRVVVEPTGQAVDEVLAALRPLIDRLDAAAADLAPAAASAVVDYLRRVAGVLRDHAEGRGA